MPTQLIFAVNVVISSIDKALNVQLTDCNATLARNMDILLPTVSATGISLYLPC